MEEQMNIPFVIILPSRSRASTMSLSLSGAAEASFSAPAPHPLSPAASEIESPLCGNDDARPSSPAPSSSSFGEVVRPKSFLLHSPNSFDSPKDRENHSPRRHCGHASI